MRGYLIGWLVGWCGGAGSWVPCTPYHVAFSAAIIVAAVHCRNSTKKKLDFLGRDYGLCRTNPQIFHVSCDQGWFACAQFPTTYMNHGQFQSYRLY